MLLAYLWQGLAIGGMAAAQPGPFQAFLLSRTLQQGWRRTLLATFAPLLSDGPIIALVLLVLTQTPIWLLNLLRIGGGLFLLYLTWQAYQGYRKPTALQPDAASAQQGLLEAALMNALSPNPYLFWGTFAGPILIEAWRQSAAWGIAFVLGFYATLIGGFMGFVALFATAGRLDPRLSRALSLFSAVALLGFALYQLWVGGTALL